MTVTRRALVVCRDAPEEAEERLGRMLAFFGIPAEVVRLTQIANRAAWDSQGTYVVLGSAESCAAAMALPGGAALLKDAAATYVYATENRHASTRALSAIAGAECVLQPPAQGVVSIDIAECCPEVTGPMSGLRVATRLAAEDSSLRLSNERNTPLPPSTRCQTLMPILSVNGEVAFGRLDGEGPPVFVCASAAIVDIDQPVRRNFYDVKDHFLSAVPLVMFITWAFRDVMWRPGELGACLIIDDPLLKRRYGFCDFQQLRDLMKQHGFTTSVAFIPWNWRRTTRAGSELFRRDANLFSVSIHGCDHVAAEFGTTSAVAIDNAVRLAQQRMTKHQERTQIRHDPVMVFPQGVFSSICPEILKRNGLVAAINTEVSPVDPDGARTLIRDVWDVAILRYGSFPIFTRRYAHHGLENFAFDLLVGKPCFIVAHHEFFRDNGAMLLDLIARLSRLQCDLRWRSPLEVIRRSYRRRAVDDCEQYEMYGNELLLPTALHAKARPFIRKKEHDAVSIDDVQCNGESIQWGSASGYLTFSPDVSATGETLVALRYKRNSAPTLTPRSLQLKASVAARRLLSEARDEYVQKVWFRSGASGMGAQ